MSVSVQEPDELPEIGPWGFIISMLVIAHLCTLSRKDRERFFKFLDTVTQQAEAFGNVLSIRGANRSPDKAASEARNRRLAINWLTSCRAIWVTSSKALERSAG